MKRAALSDTNQTLVKSRNVNSFKMKGMQSMVAESRSMQNYQNPLNNHRIEINGDTGNVSQALDTEILEDGFTLPKR
jgi:hypothetical protein